VRFDRRIKWLGHIVSSCDSVSNDVSGFSKDQFGQDMKTVRSVLYLLLAISEAARRLDHDEKNHGADKLSELYPETPWADIRALGNVLRHEYDSINLNMIWKTATAMIGPLRDVAVHEIERLRKIVSDNEPGTT
jgi:uncharacterized protein with HEPN domain